MGPKARYLSGLIIAAVTVAAFAAPAAVPARATAGLSLQSYPAVETARGPARTAALPGGGLLVVNALGEVTSQAADGRVNWTRSSSSLYRDWGVQWQTPSYVLTPQLPWGTNPVNPLQFSGANVGLVNDVTPFAVGDLAGDGGTDVAVAEVVGVDTTGDTDCAGCMTPFDVPGSTLHLGTFVTVLDGRTGRTLYDELDPGYVTQLAIVGGRLIVGDETGDPQRPDGIGAWGSVTTVRALSFVPAGQDLAAHQDWQYSTGSPWARLLGVAVTGPDTVAVSWSDTPEGLGVPGPPDGHVLLFDARTGTTRWQVRTTGYPVLLAADPSRQELVTVELTDPTVSTGYTVDGLKLADGSTTVSVSQSGALPLSLAVGQPGRNAGSEWAVGAVNAKVPAGAGGYNATSGRVSLIDPATGREAWSAELARDADGVPQPGGVVFAAGAVVAGSWLSTVWYPTAKRPDTQLDSVTALSVADGATRWQQTGDPGDPMSLSVSADGQAVRAVTSRQVIESYSGDGSVSSSTAAPGDLLSAVTASVTGPGSTDLVAGDENGEVYAYDGADLADGRAAGPRVLWQTMLPGPVQDIVTANLSGNQVLVAAATTAVAVLDARTGRIITLVSLPSAYDWTVAVAADGATPVAVVPGRSLTAYALATGKVKWRYQAPGTAMFSNAAVADGIVAAEYSSAEISGNAASTMGTVGIDAATGKPAWAVPADPATTQRGQLWQGVIASPAIPAAGGYGVATSWETPQGEGRVEVRDIRTGTLLYADTDDVLDFHTGFAADPRLGLVAISQQGAALITPTGSQDNTITANGLSATVAGSAGTGPVLLIANAETYAYGPDLFTSTSANDLAIDDTFNAGTVLSADFAGNGTDQVVALPANWDAFQIVNSEIGRPVNPYFETLQHGLDVLTLTPGSPSSSGSAAPPPPAGGPVNAARQPAATWQEPARQGGARPFFIVERHAKAAAADSAAGGTPPPGYSPAQMNAYLGLTGDGSGQTIAIVDAYRDPTIVADAEQFSTQFGLPGVCGAGGTAGDCFKLKVSRPDGTAGTDQGWDLETALDVEWTHALAPRATIMLVEAHDSTFASLFRAVDVAVAAHPAAVSMSWGEPFEFSDETYYDGHCAVTSTVCVVSSGDYGHPGSYPAYSPHVIAVGGTTLNLAADGSVISELAWSDSGGGQSWVEPGPGYQQQVAPGNWRQLPDVSYDADPATGVAVYDGTSYQGQTGWFQVGGTSVGAPSWSAILADADQLRAAAGRAPLTAAGYAAQLAIYGLPAGDLAEITSGPPNGFCPVGCTPGPGFDDITGLGSPRHGIDAALAAAP
jgi:PQQ-like domain/PQQ enzyme repeat